MSHDPPADETPLQRALRLKTEANDAKAKAGAGQFDRRRTAGLASGKSRPSPKAR